MKRRDVLYGLGATTLGSAALFGTGAFTQVTADRDLTVALSNDADALLSLVPNTDLQSVFEQNGVLVLDSDALSASDRGFNVSAQVEIGATDASSFGAGDVVDGDEAFRIISNSTAGPVDITLDATNVQPSDSGTLTLVANEVGGTAQRTAGSPTTLTAVDELLVAIEFDTDQQPAGGTIEITAEVP